MKKEEFKKLIRPLIKEELYEILNDVLPSLLSEIVVTNLSVGQAPQKTNVSPRKPNIQFSNNPVLNEIFQQTQGGISDGSEMVGLDGNFSMAAEMMDSPFSRNPPQQPLSTEFSTGDYGQKISLSELEQAAPSVAAALTKDYSKLLKAVDKKKSASGPSNIDFTNYHG